MTLEPHWLDESLLRYLIWKIRQNRWPGRISIFLTFFGEIQDVITQRGSPHRLDSSVILNQFFELFSAVGFIVWMKARSHNAGMIWKRNKVITDRPPVHTMPAWKSLENGMEWKRDACRYEAKTEPFLSSCEYPMLVGFDAGTTWRLITQWNKAGTYGVIICQQRKVRSTNLFHTGIVWTLSVRNRIMPVPS